MSRPFLSDDAKAALLAASREIEARSCAEVVISVRPRSGSYLQVDLALGIVAGAATTALLCFLPQSFGLLWFVLDPLIAGALAALASSRLPRLRRALTPPGVRRRWSERAARALFVERRVHATAGRTGLLVYVSLLERELVLVADLGLEEAVARAAGWLPAVAALVGAVRQGADGLAASRLLQALAAPLDEVLPHRDDDVNELADEMDSP